MSEITNLQYPGKIVPKSTIFGQSTDRLAPQAFPINNNKKITRLRQAVIAIVLYALYVQQCILFVVFYASWLLHLVLCNLFLNLCLCILSYAYFAMQNILCFFKFHSMHLIVFISLHVTWRTLSCKELLSQLKNNHKYKN